MALGLWSSVSFLVPLENEFGGLLHIFNKNENSDGSFGEKISRVASGAQSLWKYNDLKFSISIP